VQGNPEKKALEKKPIRENDHPFDYREEPLMGGTPLI